MKAHALFAPTLLCLAPVAHAQLNIDWYTIDGGGGTSAGGSFSITGTIGQPDAAASAGGTFQCGGGFWGTMPGAQLCYPNCDASTAQPALNVADYICFMNKYAAGDSYANCDGSSLPPVLNVADYICFMNSYAAGCP